jgi:hypothetical protein
MTFRNHCMRELKILITGLASPAVLFHGKNIIYESSMWLQGTYLRSRYLIKVGVMNDSITRITINKYF